jgi:transposase
VANFDAKIGELLEGFERLAQNARTLRSIPGIGPVTATTLLAQVPELGSLSPKKIAVLGDLAPFNLDSCQLQGVRRIKGARKRVRDALYIAAIAAARSHARFKAIYQRLRAAGKPAKVGLIAVARKLLITANAVLRDNVAFIKLKHSCSLARRQTELCLPATV